MKNTYLTLLLLTAFTNCSYGQTTWGESGSRTDTRDDAGLQGNAGAMSGFYQTYNPINFPGAAPSWWHLLDVRHSNPANNYAMQFAGGFFDQNLFFRKTNNNPSQPWSRVLLETDGKVGVGTSSPVFKLNIASDISMNADVDVAQFGITGSSDTRKRIVMGYDTNGDGFGYIKAGFYTQRWTNLSLQPNGGNVGIGTSTPQANLHIQSSGSSANTTDEYSGNLIIQGSSGSRSAISGASLEFVIPANTDGSNPWGQGRIITVAGNGNTGNATGKMILGTRRMFDKGSGPNLWNYGDDIVIDGAGHVGINTLYPREALSVNGSIRSKEVKVETANWPDYVFRNTYQLKPLAEVQSFIDQNHHLPEIPTDVEVSRDGLDLGRMNKLLLKKVEELTLYLIQLKKENAWQNKRLKKLENCR